MKSISTRTSKQFSIVDQLLVFANAGLCSTGSTSAQGQDQTTWGELHGQESSQMRKPSLLFPWASLMELNGSSCDASDYSPSTVVLLTPHRLFQNLKSKIKMQHVSPLKKKCMLAALTLIWLFLWQIYSFMCEQCCHQIQLLNPQLQLKIY